MHLLLEFIRLVRSAWSCDETSSACLKNLRDVYFIWLLGCTLLVAVGLAMEAGEIWHDTGEAIWEKSRERKHWLSLPIDREEYPPRVSRSKKLFASLGWALIIVGVFGEGLCEGFVYEYDLALSNLSDSSITENKKETAELRKQAAELTAGNLKLEAQIAPRRLTIDQQRSIAGHCSTFKNLFAGKRIKLVSYSLDTEGFVLAEQLVTALRMKPCEMFIDDDAMTVTPGEKVVFGINVFGTDSELAKKIAEAIGSSGKPIAVGFTATDPTAGSIVSLSTANSRLPHDAIVLVGLKPPDADTIKELNRITAPTKPANP
jgi:hypothetical protein